MRRSAFPTSPSAVAVGALLVGACTTPRLDSGRSSAPIPGAAASAVPARTAGFAFSHDNSREQRWPFGLNDVTTKFVAEPASADEFVSSYWVVRSEPGYAPPPGELRAEFRVRPEFPDGAFAPRPTLDYELVLGVDSSDATTCALDAERVEVRSPASSAARQRGFILRARFPGDADPHEPPKSLLVELVAVRDASGQELPLGEPRIARWLIVEPTASAVQKIRAPSSGSAARVRARYTSASKSRRGKVGSRVEASAVLWSQSSGML